MRSTIDGAGALDAALDSHIVRHNGLGLDAMTLDVETTMEECGDREGVSHDSMAKKSFPDFG